MLQQCGYRCKTNLSDCSEPSGLAQAEGGTTRRRYSTYSLLGYTFVRSKPCAYCTLGYWCLGVFVLNSMPFSSPEKHSDSEDSCPNPVRRKQRHGDTQGHDSSAASVEADRTPRPKKAKNQSSTGRLNETDNAASVAKKRKKKRKWT